MKLAGKKLGLLDISLLFILLLGTLLRFYKLSHVAGFDFDQEYAANFAYNVIHLHQKLLIGEGLSIQGLFMGPWYFYYLTPFFALTRLYPLGGDIGSVLLGVFTIWSFYFVGSRLFSKAAGVISAFISAILVSFITADASMVPTYSSTFIILFTWYLFYRYFKGETKIFPLLGLLFGLYTSIHPILFPFYFVFLGLILLKRKLPTLKQFLLSVGAFILPNLPLLLFEYWHSFLEVKELSSLFSGHSASEGKSFMTTLNYLRIVFTSPPQFLGITQISPLLLSLLLFLTAIFLIVKKVGVFKEPFHWQTLLLTYLIILLYYSFYPAHVPEYYFYPLFILPILYVGGMLGLLFQKRAGKFAVLAALLVMTVLNLQTLFSIWNNPSTTSLFDKDKIVSKIAKRQPEGSRFYISYIASPGWKFGFDYLFKYYNRIPSGEVKQPIYTIVSPISLSPGSVVYSSGNIGLILPQ